MRSNENNTIYDYYYDENSDQIVCKKQYITESLNEDVINPDEEGPSWRATIVHKAEDGTDTKDTIELNAPEFDTAVKYTEQHIRLLTKDDDKYNSASIEGLVKLS